MKRLIILSLALLFCFAGCTVNETSAGGSSSEQIDTRSASETLFDYYASVTAPDIPKIIVTANDKPIPYKAVRQSALSPDAEKDGLYFYNMAQAEPKPTVVEREVPITISFSGSAPQTVAVVDHILSLKTGFSILRQKEWSESPIPFQENTTVYTVAEGRFRFQAGYYKEPRESLFSGFVPYRGFQLKCEIEGVGYEYYFMIDTGNGYLVS